MLHRNIPATVREYSGELVFAIVSALGFTIAALLISNRDDLTSSDKFSIDILLVFLEVVIVVGLFNFRMLRTIANSLPILQRGSLTDVTYRLLEARMKRLLEFQRQLEAFSDYDLEKYEMYQELIMLTQIMSMSKKEDVIAISSVNIEDFLQEPLAERYLVANQEAVSRGVRVRRIFLLSDADLRRGEIHEVLKKHGHSLRPRADSKGAVKESGVLWLLKKDVKEHSEEDFALFVAGVLVRQAAGGQMFELSQNEDVIRSKRAVFDELWLHEKAKKLQDLPPLGAAPKR